MPLHVPTPLWTTHAFTDGAGRPVLLKMEALQPVGSFKIRGIGRLAEAAREAGAPALVSSSGGNAGLAAAYAGRQLGIPVAVFVPETTGEAMRERLRAEGAAVEVAGPVWDDAHRTALKAAEETGARLVHPFDDPEIWAGHATLVEELAAEGPRPGGIVLSVGGGGLLLGVLEGLEKVGWQDVPVHAVETEGAASLARSLEAGRIITLDGIDSVATSLGACRVADAAFERAREWEVRSHLVSDRAAVGSLFALARAHRILVEPACGAALAALDHADCAAEGDGPLVVIVCGGAAAIPESLEAWKRQTTEDRPASPTRAP